VPEIQRYKEGTDPLGYYRPMESSPEGGWVSHRDHLTALEQQRKQVIAEVEEALTSDEALLAVARERFDYLSGYSGPRWEEAHESIRRQEEDKARLFLEAAVRVAAFKEDTEHGDQRRDR
jgi:hypothetical protein